MHTLVLCRKSLLIGDDLFAMNLENNWNEGIAMYRRITYIDRLHIERLYNSRKSIRYIAAVLGFSPSSIHYELQHGFYDHLDGETWNIVRRYSAAIAQRHADFQATAKGRPLKLGKNHAYAHFVANEIRSGQSPDSIVGRLRLESRWTVSTTTLYRYIDAGYIPGISNHDLLEKENRKKAHSSNHTAKRAPAGRSIERRPESINARESFGHWEMDSVVGKSKGKGQTVLVLTERFTRYEIIVHQPDKTAKSVVNSLNEIIRQFPAGVFRTITMDNGSEFSNAHGIEFDRKGKRQVYAFYCHPYTSCERGSNENANKIIRRFFPKGSSLENCTSGDCQRVMDYMNNLPRKILGYHTAAELFQACVNNLHTSL